MIEIYAITAAVLIAAGIALGVVFITAMAVRDEKNAGRWLARGSPSRRAAGVRSITGLQVRRSGVTF